MTPLLDSDRYYVTMCGKVFARDWIGAVPGRHPTPFYRTYKGRQLKTYVSPAGYEYVGVTIGVKRYSRLVHRLVATYFIPNPDNLPEVNHKDLNKSNNKVSNLEWVSRAGNLLHAEQNGRKCIGESVGTSILVEEDVLKIVDMLRAGGSQTEIGKMFGVGNHAIYRIAHGYNWSWLTGIGRKVGE